MTQAQLAALAQVHISTMGRIEIGTRRTRRSTLDRIAKALCDAASEELGESSRLLEVLVAAAGMGLAPESPFMQKGIARRRQHRMWR